MNTYLNLQKETNTKQILKPNAVKNLYCKLIKHVYHLFIIFFNYHI